MKNVTPRRETTPRTIGKALFFLFGFLYAAWETRALWRELVSALSRLKNR